MPRDGSCLFRSAAVQDGSYGYSAHKRLRCDAIAYVLSRRAHFREFFATVDQDAVPWPNFHDASHPSYLSLTEQCTVASIDRWLARPSAWSVHRFLSLVFRFPRCILSMLFVVDRTMHCCLDGSLVGPSIRGSYSACLSFVFREASQGLAGMRKSGGGARPVGCSDAS